MTQTAQIGLQKSLADGAAHTFFKSLLGRSITFGMLGADRNPPEVELAQQLAHGPHVQRHAEFGSDPLRQVDAAPAGHAAAIKVLRAAGRPNSGVIVDTLHFDRSFSSIDDLRSVPGEWLHYRQICDGPAEQPATVEAMIHIARVERMFPGEGGIDLAAIIRPLPRGLPCSIEIPTARFGNEERARRSLETSRALIAAL